VVVVEDDKSVNKRKKVKPYGQIKGWAMSLDGNRNPNPSIEGEVRVIQNALDRANVTPKEIDYINPHATGSLIGDEVELNAIQNCGLSHAGINATKSITGHGLSSSGTVEVIASLLQMAASRIHPTRNLETPIYPHFNWVKQKAVNHCIEHALNLSFGFGGVNSAICLKSYS
jgi:malonyl-ACP decarboxylase